jgi:ribosomal protein S18 acetylase RimI-like enzyme
MSDEIPHLSLFMKCEALNTNAISDMPRGFHIRNCEKSELAIWKSMPFGTPLDAPEQPGMYYDFMSQYYNLVYAKKCDLFFQKCLFACNEDNIPVGTCFAWKAYEKITTIHWFKVLRKHEGKGIGRALLSTVMKNLSREEFPIFLHTHPSSFRAIKLYSDFGFSLLSDPIIGSRKNGLVECLPILQKHMLPQDYQRLTVAKSPQFFLDAVKNEKENETEF